MADNRKYYYLKLKESYFDDDAIVLLESMQDGVIYSNILLKLYLKSLKNGGKLQLDENIPYTAQMIATITRQQVGTVERALKIFMKLGLVEPLPSGALYMSNIELLIGQSSTEGERKRRARLALQEQKALPQTGADKCPPYRADICPPEIEIEKEIDIEIEKERELETGHPAPAAYGRYHNVILSDTELDGLKTELPGKWEYYIDRLSCHIASSGRKYKSHAATIFKWAQEDAAKKAPKKGIPDYTCKEGKSYFAGCIANALMEREIPVCMTNFALILGDLAASFEGRNEYISRLCSFPLLILDDFGMERGTEYGLEQVYNVIDSRYRSGRPLIVTTNLTLEDLQHPEDTAHARIYDRLIEMCSPVRFTGSNFRKATAQEKMGQLKKLMNRKESRL